MSKGGDMVEKDSEKLTIDALLYLTAGTMVKLIIIINNNLLLYSNDSKFQITPAFFFD